MIDLNDSLPFSAPCERNKDVILNALKPYLSDCTAVLEIGSGTAQHAIHFAQSQPHLQWQTTDQPEYLDGIKARCEYAKLGNVLLPFVLDVNQDHWLPKPGKYTAVYTANTHHIMDWSSVQAFFKGLPSVTQQNSLLFIYGPFKYNGEFTSPSNYEFDQSLRSRGVGSAIRDFEEIQKCANTAGFQLVKDIQMPANNQLLVWKRSKV